MKHTEKEIEEIAKNTLAKIHFSYDDAVDMGIEKVDLDLSYHNMDKPSWSVCFEFGKGYLAKNRKAFLYIDDESGNPVIIWHGQAKIYLTINDDGTIEKTIKRFGED